MSVVYITPEEWQALEDGCDVHIKTHDIVLRRQLPGTPVSVWLQGTLIPVWPVEHPEWFVDDDE